MSPEVILPIVLALVMLSLGLDLTPNDFLRILSRPRIILAGLFCQIIVLPVLAYAVVTAFGFDGFLAVGFVLLSACPGGVTSNIITKISEADVALSVTLTACSTVISVLWLPVLLTIAFDQFVAGELNSFKFLSLVLSMLGITIVPVLIGMAFRFFLPRVVTKLSKFFYWLVVVLFSLVVVGTILTNWGLFAANVARLGGALISTAIVASLIGLTLAKLIGGSRREATTISIETAVQNPTMGIAIASLALSGSGGFNELSLPVAIYGVMMLPVALCTGLLLRKTS